MSPHAWSLRARLTVIILAPLLLLGGALGLWQVRDAQATARAVFERSLLSAALSVANDVTVSGGDALSERTRVLLADTSGGPVFYHVYAPDGVIVAGYATPPVGIPSAAPISDGPLYFDAVYLGKAVSGVRIQARSEIGGFAGLFTTTVWQDSAVRGAFERSLVLRTLGTIVLLLTALALIVWFGVRHGLRPLVDLEEAIRRRSSVELSAIQRPVPVEVAGIVGTLNGLFAQVSQAMGAQAVFLSNAAHQLRTPLAGVLSMAEAVARAPSGAEAQARATDLVEAAQEAAELSEKLLLLDRASAGARTALDHLDLAPTLTAWAQGFAGEMPPGVRFESDIATGLGTLTCDGTMLREALRNLVDNATRHGGPDLSLVRLSAHPTAQGVELTVSDNGAGLAAQDHAAALERFRPLAATSGSGLGLSIARAVAEAQEGRLSLGDASPGLIVRLSLPRDVA